MVAVTALGVAATLSNCAAVKAARWTRTRSIIPWNADAKFVAATLLFLISVGTLRSWLAYAALSQKAGDIDGEAGRLVAAGKVDAFEAQRLLAEYQLARASAPLVPTWVWRLHRESLNKNWELKRPQD